jgi:hypothetical protein
MVVTYLTALERLIVIAKEFVTDLLIFLVVLTAPIRLWALHVSLHAFMVKNILLTVQSVSAVPATRGCLVI